MIPVDLSVFVDNLVLPILTPLLIALVGWAAQRVAAYAHFQISDGQRALVATAVTNGIAFAQQKLGPYEKVNADAHIGAVLAYVLPKIPDALKSLGITPDHLAQIITAKLPAA